MLEVDRKGLQTLDAATKSSRLSSTSSRSRAGEACAPDLRRCRAERHGQESRQLEWSRRRRDPGSVRSDNPASERRSTPDRPGEGRGPVLSDSFAKLADQKKVASNSQGPPAGIRTQAPVPTQGPVPPSVAATDAERPRVARNDRWLVALAVGACGVAFATGLFRRNRRHRLDP